MEVLNLRTMSGGKYLWVCDSSSDRYERYRLSSLDFIGESSDRALRKLAIASSLRPSCRKDLPCVSMYSALFGSSSSARFASESARSDLLDFKNAHARLL